LPSSWSCSAFFLDHVEYQQDYPSLTAAAQAVAKQLGLGRETVHRWVVQAEVDGGSRPGASSAEHAEIKRLVEARVRLISKIIRTNLRIDASRDRGHEEGRSRTTLKG
jgi:transposase-like protein